MPEKTSKTKLLLALVFILLTAQGCGDLGVALPFINQGPPNTLGVLKSIDGGAHWQRKVRVENKPDKNIANVHVNEMVFDPNDSQIIYLATPMGLLISKNAAETWSQILQKLIGYDLYVDPQNTKTVFVSGTFGNHGKILRTADGGATWDEIYNEANPGNAVNSIIGNPDNSKEIYAGLASGTLLKSADAGGAWSILYDFKQPVLRMRYGNDNRALYVLLREQLMKSNDSGRTWTSISSSLRGVSDFARMYLDRDVQGVILLTSSKGLYRSLNDGRTWESLQLPGSTRSQQTRAVASMNGGAIMYVSVNNVVFKSLDNGATWQTQKLPVPSNPSRIIIDPKARQTVYIGL